MEMVEAGDIGSLSPQRDRPSEPALIAVCGVPGVGKTTVARAVADRLDGELLRTDVVRKEILPDPEYTEEETRMVYRELFDRGREAIERGDAVVLDGTFRASRFRDGAADVADSLNVDFRLVKVECSPDVVKERIAHREDDESDADFEIHVKYRKEFEPIERDHLTVDNSGALEETRRRIRRLF